MDRRAALLLLVLSAISALSPITVAAQVDGKIIASGVLYDASGMNTMLACSDGLCVLVGDRVASFFYQSSPLSLLVLPAPIADTGLSCRGGACVVGFQVANRVYVYRASLEGGVFRLEHVETLYNASLVRSRTDLLVFVNNTLYRYAPGTGGRVPVLEDPGFKPTTSPWPECYAGGGYALCAGRMIENVVFASRTGAVVYREGNASIVLWRGGEDRVEGEVYVAGSIEGGVCLLYSRPGDRSIVFRAKTGAGVYEKTLGPADLVSMVTWRDWCAITLDDKLYTYTAGKELQRLADGYYPALMGPTPIGLHASSIVLQKPLGGNLASYLIVTRDGLYAVNGTSVPGAVAECGPGGCAAYIPPSTLLYKQEGSTTAWILDLSTLIPVSGGFLALGYDGKLYMFSSEGVEVLASCKSKCTMTVQGDTIVLLEENGLAHVVVEGGGERRVNTMLSRPGRAMLLSLDPLVLVASNGTHTSLASSGETLVSRGALEAVYAYGEEGLEYAAAVLNTSTILFTSPVLGKSFILDASLYANHTSLPWITVCDSRVVVWAPGAKAYRVYTGPLDYRDTGVEGGALVGFDGECKPLIANGSSLVVDGKQVCSTSPAFIAWSYTLPNGLVLVGAPPSTYLLIGEECKPLDIRVTNPLDPGTRILVAKGSGMLRLSMYLSPTGEVVVARGSEGVEKRAYDRVYNVNPLFERPELLALRGNEYVIASIDGRETGVALPVLEEPYQAVIGPSGVIATYLIGLAAVKIFTAAPTLPQQPSGGGGAAVAPVTSIASTTTTTGPLTSTATTPPVYMPTNTTTAPAQAPSTPFQTSTPQPQAPRTTTTTTVQGGGEGLAGLWLPLLVAGIALTVIGVVLILRARRK